MRAAAVAAIAAIGLVGCSASAPDPGDSTGSISGDITMVSPLFVDSASQEALDTLLESFEEEYPDVTVEVDYTDYSKLNEKLATSLAGGRPYDVMMLGVGWVPPFAARGVLAELEADRGPLEETFYPRSLDAAMYEGAVYALPVVLDLRCAIYRLDAFEEIGLEGPPTNFTELREFANDLTTHQGTVVERAGIDFFSLRHAFETLLYANGGTLFNEDSTEPTFNSPAGVEALQLMTDLVREDGVLDPSMLQQQAGQAGYPILQDRAAMMFGINTVWNAAEQERPDLIEQGDLGCFLIQDDRPAMFLGGTMVSMSADSEHPEAARALVDFMASEEAAVVSSLASGSLPALIDARDNEQLPQNPFVDYQFENIEHAFSEGGPAAWLEIRGDFQTAIEEALLGQKTPQQALDGLADAAREAMNR